MIFIPRKWVFIIIIFLILALTIPVSLKIYDTILRFRYPLKYMDIVEKYADEYGIDPYLVLAVIKAESNFNPEAVSIRGAVGLMQIHPDTGEWIAKNLGINRYSNNILYAPETNIRFGCWYLNNLNQEFKDPVLVLAAYNAGSGNVLKWLNNTKYSKDGKELSDIPFKETRDYIEKITRNYKMYTRLYKEQKKEGISINETNEKPKRP
ncbi:MAG: lytic transglycosylase domain-containing protein [Thermoanaerobacteraceae bacterium]|nr:lytic transglycosylase domain-containing protein [Thermoanaerobacteraceae bacterium]